MTLDIDRVTQLRDCGQKVTQNILCVCIRQDDVSRVDVRFIMEYSGIPTALATDDMGTDPGSMPPRHQTSLLGIDIVTGQMTDDSLARPVIYNVVDHATTSILVIVISNDF